MIQFIKYYSCIVDKGFSSEWHIMVSYGMLFRPHWLAMASLGPLDARCMVERRERVVVVIRMEILLWCSQSPCKHSCWHIMLVFFRGGVRGPWLFLVMSLVITKNNHDMG